MGHVLRITSKFAIIRNVIVHADWSPFPDEFANVRKLYFCEYDLVFFKHRSQMLRHLKKVKVQHPPGIEIYRHNGISMFEVDGSKAKTYCQNLCYLAKLFLDHKSLDVRTFERLSFLCGTLFP